MFDITRGYLVGENDTRLSSPPTRNPGCVLQMPAGSTNIPRLGWRFIAGKIIHFYGEFNGSHGPLKVHVPSELNLHAVSSGIFQPCLMKPEGKAMGNQHTLWVDQLSGWWFQPTPLKNTSERQLGCLVNIPN